MAKIKLHDLERLAEPLLLPLYFRTMENRRPDPLVRDPLAQTLLDQIDYDFSTFESLSCEQAGALLRTRLFDSCTQAFLQAHPAGLVVEIGCGLETRFCRLDNGMQDWYDLDLPEVIALRKQLLAGSCFAEKRRYHLIACSALDPHWIDLLSDKSGRPFLFLAEGYLASLEEADARRLVVGLRSRFPGAELVLDTVVPGEQQSAWTSMGWGFAGDRDIEAWAEGIRLLEAWSFDRAAPVPEQAGQVLRFRLGQPAADLSYASLRASLGEQEEISP